MKQPIKTEFTVYSSAVLNRIIGEVAEQNLNMPNKISVNMSLNSTVKLKLSEPIINEAGARAA
jgi:hypothetical protein